MENGKWTRIQMNQNAKKGKWLMIQNDSECQIEFYSKCKKENDSWWKMTQECQIEFYSKCKKTQDAELLRM